MRVVSLDRLYRVVERIASTKKPMCLRNEDDDLRFFLYAVGYTDKIHTSLYIGESKTVVEIREAEQDKGDDDDEYDDDDVLLMGEFSIRRGVHGAANRQLVKLRQLLEECTELRVCCCKRSFIYDREDMCCVCHLTATDDDLKNEFCSICQDSGCRKVMRATECCNNYLHQKCFARLPDGRCPYCRHQLVEDEDENSEELYRLASSGSSSSSTGSAGTGNRNRSNGSSGSSNGVERSAGAESSTASCGVL